MRPLRAVAPALVAMLAFTACSDDGGLDPDEEADLLEEAILTIDDLPDGFEASEPSDEDEEDFEDCLEEVDVDPDALDDATVADEGPVVFEVTTEEGGFGAIDVELRSLEDTGVVDDLREGMADGDFQDCLVESVEEDAEADDQEVEDLELEEIDPAVDGDQSSALAFSGSLSGFDLVGELHVVLVGDHLIRAETILLDHGLDDDAVEDAIDAMIGRLGEAS